MHVREMKVRPLREAEIHMSARIDQILRESADAISCMHRCTLGVSISQSKAVELSERFLKLLYDANETRRLLGSKHSSLDPS